MATTNGSPELWDLEAEEIAKAVGDLEEARTFVLVRWMYGGDFRPFLAWKPDIDATAVLGMLTHMIIEDRLKVTHPGRHRHKDPSARARSRHAALQYERSKGGTSDERFAKVAADLGMSPEYVRRADTALRKARARKLLPT